MASKRMSMSHSVADFDADDNSSDSGDDTFVAVVEDSDVSASSSTNSLSVPGSGGGGEKVARSKSRQYSAMGIAVPKAVMEEVEAESKDEDLQPHLRRGVSYGEAEADTVYRRKNVDQMVAESRNAIHARESRALMAWCNTFLRRRNLQAKELGKDFQDGVLLLSLAELAYKSKLRKAMAPKRLAAKLDNLANAFNFLEKQGVLLLSVDSHDIVGGKEKQTLTLLFNMLRNLTVRGLRTLMEDGEEDPANAGKKPAKVREYLTRWTKQVCEASDNVPELNDFWKSFQDGRLFCAIVDRLAPGHIDVGSLDPAKATENLALAFRVAEEQLGIPALLEVSDFKEGAKPDEKSVENYLSMLVSAGHARAQEQGKVADLKKKMEEEKKKKADEVEALRRRVEEEQKQFEAVASDLAKFKELRAQAIERSKALEADVDAAAAEREEFARRFDAIAADLEKSHAALARSQQRERDLLDRQRELEELVAKRAEEVDSLHTEVTGLNSQIYEQHRELENVVANFRTEMKDATIQRQRDEAEERQGDMSTMIVEALRAQKSYSDFLSAMETRKGWLMKRRPGNAGRKKFFGGASFKKRFFELKGDTLYWYKTQGGNPKGKAKLKYYKKVAFDVPGVGEHKELYKSIKIRKGSVMVGDAKESFVLRLEPLDPKDAKVKPMELVAIDTLVEELKEDIFAWVAAVNTRIALIHYLSDMFEKRKGQPEQGGRPAQRGSRELVEYVIEPDRAELKIEHHIADHHGALEQFKEVLIMRRGLRFVLNNIALVDQSCAVLGEIFTRNNSIRYAELRRNLITSVGAQALAQALRINTSLRVLILDRNQLGDKGVRYIAEALPSHRALERVSLASNNVSDLGLLALVQGLEKSAAEAKGNAPHVFPAIEMSGNAIGDEGVASLAQLCKTNRTIRSIDLRDNVVTDKGAESLARALLASAGGGGGDADAVGGVSFIDLAGNQLTSKGVAHLAASFKALSSDFTVDLSDNKLITRKGIAAVLDANVDLKFDKFKVVKLAGEEMRQEAEDADDDGGDDDDELP